MKHSRRGGVMGVLLLLIVGVMIGAGVYYFVVARPAPGNAPASPESGAPPPTVEAEPADENYVQRKLREWNLTGEDIKRELATAGKVVREKGAEFGSKIAAATSDVTIIAKVKLKYTLDDRLKALQIVVGCKEGHVTLTGTVAAHELIGRAVVLAMDTEGVVDVTSSLTVK